MARRALPKLRPAAPNDGAQDTAGMYAALAQGGARRHVPIEALTANPNQPRRSFDSDALTGLAASINTIGLLHPPRVRQLAPNRYELIAGERRWRAVQQLGHTEIAVVVGEADAGASALAALAENVHRADLNPIEEARAYALLVEEFGLTREELGRQLNKSRPAVSNTIRLLDLPATVLELLASNQLTAAHGRTLLTEPDHTQRSRLAASAVADGWTVRHLEQAIAAAGRKAARPAGPSADHRAVADEYAEQIARNLNRETRVDPRRTGGFRLTVDFADVDDVRAFISHVSGSVS